MKKSDWANNLLRDDYFIEMMEELRGVELAKFLNSEEYKEYLELQEKALQEYKQKAKDYFESLETDKTRKE